MMASPSHSSSQRPQRSHMFSSLQKRRYCLFGGKKVDEIFTMRGNIVSRLNLVLLTTLPLVSIKK